jgi:predicted ATP-dependent serine protease
MALAIITSLKNKSLGVSEVYPFSKSAEASAESRRNNSPKKQIAHPPIVFGELGLLGEIRPVIGVDKRQQTARKLGYSTFIGVGERHIREIRI